MALHYVQPPLTWTKDNPLEVPAPPPPTVVQQSGSETMPARVSTPPAPQLPQTWEMAVSRVSKFANGCFQSFFEGFRNFQSSHCSKPLVTKICVSGIYGFQGSVCFSSFFTAIYGKNKQTPPKPAFSRGPFVFSVNSSKKGGKNKRTPETPLCGEMYPGPPITGKKELKIFIWKVPRNNFPRGTPRAFLKQGINIRTPTNNCFSFIGSLEGVDLDDGQIQ